MPIDSIIIFTIIVLALISFITEIIRVEVTALLIMVVLMVLGYVSIEEGISGFSNIATVTILALLLISEGIKQSGALRIITEGLEKFVDGNKFKLTLLMILIPGILSAFINNTAIVALFIPIVMELSKKANVAPSQLLIPLSFSSMAGGSLTLIGSSTNIIVNDIALNHGLKGFSIFEFAPIGIALLIVITLFILFFGQRLLPYKRQKPTSFTAEFNTKNIITEVVIQENSNWINKKLEETPINRSEGIEIICIIRDKNKRWLPDEIEKIRPGDILVVKSERSKLYALLAQDKQKIESSEEVGDSSLSEEGGSLVELLINPSSDLIGKKIDSSFFKEKFGAILLGIRKRRGLYLKNFNRETLNIGDVVLLSSKTENLNRIINSLDVVVLNVLSKKSIKQASINRFHAITSIVITIGVVLCSAFNILPIITAAWTGIVILFLTGTLHPIKGIKNIEWSAVLLIIGLLPLGIAMDNTGTTAILANKLVELMIGWNFYLVVAVLYFFTTILTSVLSNNATAILLAPIAILLANALHVSADALLITVILGANTSFLTPIGYQTNTMIYKPGNYKFTDFLKIGSILTILFLLVITAIVPLIYG